jgi:hypothetical protein
MTVYGLVVEQIDAHGIYTTILGVPPEVRGSYRWLMSSETLAVVRQLPPPNPDAGPIVYEPPIPDALKDPEESIWWMAGRPIRLDDDADGITLELVEANDDQEPDPPPIGKGPTTVWPRPV